MVTSHDSEVGSCAITAKVQVQSQAIRQGTFYVDKIPLSKVFLPELRFSPPSTIAPLLHTHLNVNTFFTRRTKG